MTTGAGAEGNGNSCLPMAQASCVLGDLFPGTLLSQLDWQWPKLLTLLGLRLTWPGPAPYRRTLESIYSQGQSPR